METVGDSPTPPDESPSPQPAVVENPASKRARSGLLPVSAGVVSTLLSTSNWSCVVVSAAFLLLLVDVVARAGRLKFMIRVLFAIVAGVILGRLLAVRADWAFNEALGISPPAGVTDVHISRHYTGGPGEHVMIVEFQADAAAMRDLTSRKEQGFDDDRIKRWRESGEDWSDAFSAFVISPLSGSAHLAWERIRPMQNVQFFNLGNQNSGHVAMFVEPATGRCVMLHVRY
jgi:hypothetical protein